MKKHFVKPLFLKTNQESRERSFRSNAIAC